MFGLLQQQKQRDTKYWVVSATGMVLFIVGPVGVIMGLGAGTWLAALVGLTVVGLAQIQLDLAVLVFIIGVLGLTTYGDISNPTSGAEVGFFGLVIIAGIAGWNVWRIATVTLVALAGYAVATFLTPQPPLLRFYNHSVFVVFCAIGIGLFAHLRERQTKQLAEWGEKLKTTLAQLEAKQRLEAKIAGEVQAAASGLQQQAEAQTAQAEATAEGSDRLAVEVRELAAAAQQIGQVAGAVAGQAQAAASAAATGAAASSRSGEEAVKLGEHIAAATNAIAQLVGLLTEAQQMLRVIEAVADETRLLSLNAQIEAVSAGEYGRRFAVIAREVAELASRAGNAVGTTNLLVERISAETVAAQTTTAASNAAAMSSLALTMQAVTQQQEVAKVVEESASQVSTIETAVEQQQVATTRAAEDVAVVRQLAEANAASSRTLAAIAAQLRATAAGLTANPQAADEATIDGSRPTVNLYKVIAAQTGIASV